ncbi:MAG TPA: inorganic diphosphatase [Patescibacteria group bacterium]|nr:inorganic diphosphatase [Patescibacteria group bacterium]
MNLLHDIPAGDPKTTVNVIIEIPIGSGIKYEYDKDLQVIRADRFLYTAFKYPFNYGFIPGTWSEDEDPLDIIVVSSEAVTTGTLIECKVIGMLATEDEEGKDAKLLAVPKGKVDPVYKSVEKIDDLPESLVNKIKHFYENYKSIEPGKWVKVTGWKTREEAQEEIEKGIQRYKKEFKK